LSLAQAEHWLEGLVNHERRPGYADARLGLEPIRALLARLGDPQTGLPVLHVAGSKGKGSVVLMVEALARAAGLRTGAYTSPHLSRWTERFRIDGREIDPAPLAAAVARVAPAVEALRAPGTPARAEVTPQPTWFDAVTATAFVVFAEQPLDLVLLEVGLGGRLDSTNVVAPRLCCVTSIELEHTERLGTTLSAIAAEKAGILKAGVPAVIGDLPAEARAVVEARAKEIGAPLVSYGQEFSASGTGVGAGGQRIRQRDGRLEIEAGLACLGPHQVHNASLALACARRLRITSDRDLPVIAARAFESIRLPGRIEVLERRPIVLVDSAHTRASAESLALVLAELPHRARHLVLSVSRGKDVAAICGALVPGAARVTLTRAEPSRSLELAELELVVRAAGARDVVLEADPRRALRRARATLAEDEMLCVAGSIYLAGIAREVLARD
jgi:dihydrofolate synthase/folylpolyglutamate synthase